MNKDKFMLNLPLDTNYTLKRTYLSSSSLRYLVFFLFCFGQFTNLYILQIPQGLETNLIKSKEFNINFRKYNYLFSFYNLPNIIFCIIGGILIDKFGLSKIYFISSLFFILGQMICTFSIYYNNFTFLLMGRFILGVFSGSMDIILV